MVSELRREKDRARREKRRRELLDAATRVFSAKGYHSTLVCDIAKEAGVGQGTVYRYFNDKRHIFDALFDRLVERLFLQFEEMSETLPQSEDDYRNASISAISKVVKVFGENRELSLLILHECPSIDKEFAEKLSSIYESFAELARYYLNHAISEGFARPCNTTIVSQSLIGLGIRMLENWCSGKMEDISVEEAVNELVNFAFYGFGLEKRGEKLNEKI